MYLKETIIINVDREVKRLPRLDLLKERRLLLNYTQDEIAKAMEINRALYTQKELGARGITIKDVVKLKKILRLTPKETEEIFLN